MTDYQRCLKDLPGLHYMAEPDGKVKYLSDELRVLLGYPEEKSIEYQDLFSEEDRRQVRAARENALVSQQVVIKGEKQWCYVEHSARIVKTEDSRQLVLGTIRPLAREFELQQEVEVYRQILDRREIPFGVHFVERGAVGAGNGRTETNAEEGIISWMNAWGEGRFFPRQKSNSPRSICDLAGQSEQDARNPVEQDREILQERARIRERVRQKFNGGNESNMVPREFYATPDSADAASSPQKLPFIIKDYFIYDSPMARERRQPSRIGTVVFANAIKSDLVGYLVEKSARSPVLEFLKIRAFEKRIDRSKPILFQYVNKCFQDDDHLPAIDWQKLLDRYGISASSNDRQACWDALIEKGIGDADIYSESIALRYNADDMTVFRENSPRQGLEPHPERDAENPSAPYIQSDVQFVKVPLRENDTTVGVIGFYWPVRETERIQERLNQLLVREKNEILDCLPDLMRVVRKDCQKRILFVNKQHAAAHEQPANWFIGRTDRHVDAFEKHMAIGYDADDDYVIENGKPVARIELHRDTPQSQQYNVVTIKSPIRSQYDSSVSGVQCLYWSVNALQKLLRDTPPPRPSSPESCPWLKQERAPLVFVSYAHEDKNFLLGGDFNQVSFRGLKSQLDRLEGRFWADTDGRKDRFDEEIAEKIEQCRIFILLMSAAFWNSEYIQGTELPHIQKRQLSDTSVQIIPVRVRSFHWGGKNEMEFWVHNFHMPGGMDGDGYVEQLARDGKEEEFWTKLTDRVAGIIKDLNFHSGINADNTVSGQTPGE